MMFNLFDPVAQEHNYSNSLNAMQHEFTQVSIKLFIE